MILNTHSNKRLSNGFWYSSLIYGACITFVPFTQTAFAQDTNKSVSISESSVIQIDVLSANVKHKIAFVPFDGDTVLSFIINKDLNLTKLSTTSKSLPQNIYSSKQLTPTALNEWQKLGIPYLLVGQTQSVRGQLTITYEVIDVNTGLSIDGVQSITTSNNKQDVKQTAHKIAEKIYALITGERSDLTGRIAYVEETITSKGKISTLKVVNTDGSNEVKVAQFNGSIFTPAWSPDGTKLAYPVLQQNAPTMIYLHDLVTGRKQIITPYKNTNLYPDFSPNGRHILFSSTMKGSHDIYQIDLPFNPRKPPKQLTNLPSDEMQPSYAPDGQSFVFVSSRNGRYSPLIYRYDLTTGNHNKLSQGTAYATSPSYSTDGSKIAFLNGRNAAIMSSNGQLIKDLGNTGVDGSASFSPNVKRVVYAYKRGAQNGMLIQSLEGGQSFSIKTNGTAHTPVWSPN